MKKPIRKIHSGNVLKELNKIGMVPLIISRTMVEAQNIQPALLFLRKLSKKQHVWQNRESLVLQFDGWDKDERAYFEIPELVSYIRKLSQEWNYWLWFLSPEVPDNIRMTVTVQVDPQLLRDAKIQDGTTSVGVNDAIAKEMGMTLNRLCQDTYQLLCDSGRNTEKARELTQAVLQDWLPLLGLAVHQSGT